MTGKRILITGGAGAIGVNLTELLLKEGIKEICIVDNLTSGRREFLPEDNRIRFLQADIGDAAQIASIIKECEPHYLFHLAAHFANQNSVDHPFDDLQTNVIGTMNLLEALKARPGLEKFVYASSSCVYGNSAVMRETDALYPHETPYAINKFTAELYARYYAHLHQVPTVSVRIFNTYGPYEPAGKYRNVIPNFIAQAMRAEPLIITGTGEETRDFTYASDTATLLLLAAKSDLRSGEAVNGGTGKATAIGYLARRIIELTGSSSELRFVPRRNWDQISDRCADISRAAAHLGYSPKVDFETGLKKTVEWHLKQSKD